jgi:fructuronate reductase
VTIDVRDPLAAEFRARLAGGADAEGVTAALLGIEAIFGRDLPADPRFTGPVTLALDRLTRDGARGAAAR